MLMFFYLLKTKIRNERVSNRDPKIFLACSRPNSKREKIHENYLIFMFLECCFRKEDFLPRKIFKKLQSIAPNIILVRSSLDGKKTFYPITLKYLFCFFFQRKPLFPNTKNALSAVGMGVT